ncbi:MAG: hypothetical protein NC311_18425 [Muribaculaceae bacterium]|nr:hypothetical protein [Muribaculaceae bacterium]
MVLTKEEKEKILSQIEPCSLYWDNFYVTDSGQVFTYNDETGQTAEEVYQTWLELKNNPPEPKPTTEQLLQAQIDELQKQSKLKDAQIQALSDRNDFNEDLIAELAMEVYA